MAGHKVAQVTLKPSVVRELVMGLALGLAAGGLWKMHHWNEPRKPELSMTSLREVRSVLKMLKSNKVKPLNNSSTE